MGPVLLLLACQDPVDVDPPSDTPPDSEVVVIDEGVPVEVVEGPEISCADPSLRQSEGRLWSPPDTNEWLGAQPEGIEPAISDRTAPGLAIGDIDGDGRYEVVFTNKSPSQIFSFDDQGNPSDMTDAFGLPRSEWGAWGATFADYDDDGDSDLFIAARRDVDRLFENDNGLLVDVTYTVFETVPEYWGAAGSTWGDMDGDGDLDLFVGTTDGPKDDPYALPMDGPPNLLYENRDGRLVLREDVLSFEATNNYAFGAAWVDLDDDGRLDLYQVNDHGRQTFGNKVSMNRTEPGGDVVLEDIGEAGAWVAISGMGLGIGDINGDALPDLFMADWGAVALLESAGPDTWIDSAASRGLAAKYSEGREVAWGSDLADLNNDGRLDAFTGFGKSFGAEANGREQIEEQPDALWMQKGDGSFEQVAERWGFADTAHTRAIAAVDLNDDGWLDLVKRRLDEPPVLQYQRCGEASWLKLHLKQPAPNVGAIGARVRIEADGVSQWRWLQAGGPSIGYGNPPQLHFGLDEADTVDVIEVWWPDGEVSVLQDVGANRTLWITRQ